MHDRNNYAKLFAELDLINTYQIVSNRTLIFIRGRVCYIFIKHRVTVNGHVKKTGNHSAYNSAIVLDLGLCNVFHRVQKLVGSVREIAGFTWFYTISKLHCALPRVIGFL